MLWWCTNWLCEWNAFEKMSSPIKISGPQDSKDRPLGPWLTERNFPCRNFKTKLPSKIASTTTRSPDAWDGYSIFLSKFSLLVLELTFQCAGPTKQCFWNPLPFIFHFLILVTKDVKYDTSYKCLLSLILELVCWLAGPKKHNIPFIPATKTADRKSWQSMCFAFAAQNRAEKAWPT